LAGFALVPVRRGRDDGGEEVAVSRYIELSHVIRDGMEPYPGLPPPKVRELITHAESRRRYDDQAEFSITMLEIVGNVGTYLDSPRHRFAEGPDVATIGLDRLIGLEALVIDGGDGGGPIDVVLPASLLRNRAVLFRTGWDRRWQTPAYWERGPYLSARTADMLVDAEAALVGVDFANVDDTTDPSRPVHTTLLGCEILIVEHLTGLARVPARGASFSAIPVRIDGAASLPVRAFATVDSTWQEFDGS
jgi:arylformamidase